MDSRMKIAITMGDPSGIGPEVTVKALNHRETYEQCRPVVIGDYEALIDAVKFCNLPLKLNKISNADEAVGRHGTIDYIDMGLLNKNEWKYGEVQENCGKASFEYVVKGIELAKTGEVQAVVTAPINKSALKAAGYRYSGHTEIFADYTGSKDYAMLLASGIRTNEKLCVIHVSTHVALRDACDYVTKERVLKVIDLADKGMKMLGIKKPKIAVAGLNPHCSEDGLFGQEEKREIIPAIEEGTRLGFDVTGPIPPDTVFVRAKGGEFDIVVAMYHDQGHIPLKLSGFVMDPVTHKYSSMSGINCTIGLPIIRTSVDHGTAFGKAGEGIASEDSMLDAIYAAERIAGYSQK